MPWSEDTYPASMDGLDPKVWEKAIEIANELLEEGYEEGRAIAIARSQAKDAVKEEQSPSGGEKAPRSGDRDLRHRSGGGRTTLGSPG